MVLKGWPHTSNSNITLEMQIQPNELETWMSDNKNL